MHGASKLVDCGWRSGKKNSGWKRWQRLGRFGEIVSAKTLFVKWWVSSLNEWHPILIMRLGISSDSAESEKYYLSDVYAVAFPHEGMSKSVFYS